VFEEFKLELAPLNETPPRWRNLDQNSDPFVMCLASSGSIARRGIVIDLSTYGLDSTIMNELKPTINITEYHMNHAGYNCVYSFGTVLSGSLL
jgi:hypothetical protein